MKPQETAAPPLLRPQARSQPVRLWTHFWPPCLPRDQGQAL